MSVAEFRKLAAAHASAPPPTAALTRTILAGSRIQTVLLEPVTVSGIQAGKRFHAQLNVDMTLPAGMNRRSDAIELKQGADVYLKSNGPKQPDVRRAHGQAGR